jgi:hypothetical protein
MANIDFTDKKTLFKYAPGNGQRRKMKPGRVSLVVLLAAGALLSVFLLAARTGRPAAPDLAPAGPTQAEREAAYRGILERLAGERARLYGEWRTAPTAEGRRETLAKAAKLFSESLVKDVIPCWYGTGYDFNGATETPGVGGISCGHFVTTVLRDAGLRLDRIALAQQPSEALIRSLVAEVSIRRYSGLSGKEFLAALATLPSGVYVLGLDKHVGFLVVDSSGGSSGVSFVHSTLLRPFSVVREPAASSRALMTSAYRVLGNLSGDEGLLRKWLAQEKIATRRGVD